LRKPEHAAALEQLGIAAFELVVVNLYPFSETVDSGASVDECIEQIDNRRTVDGPCGGQEPPERGGGDRPARL